VPPSLIKSGVGRVDRIAGGSSRDGRDLNGARTLRALPCEGRRAWRPVSRGVLSVFAAASRRSPFGLPHWIPSLRRNGLDSGERDARSMAARVPRPTSHDASARVGRCRLPGRFFR
jgi:hypothetical protein